MSKFEYYMWDDLLEEEAGLLYKCSGDKCWVYNRNGKMIHSFLISDDKPPAFLNYPNIYPEISEGEFLMRIIG